MESVGKGDVLFRALLVKALAICGTKAPQLLSEQQTYSRAARHMNPLLMQNTEGGSTSTACICTLRQCAENAAKQGFTNNAARFDLMPRCRDALLGKRASLKACTRLLDVNV